jgi:hypothetical protein
VTTVTPAKAGVQRLSGDLKSLGPGLRRDDGQESQRLKSASIAVEEGLGIASIKIAAYAAKQGAIWK